MSEHIVLDFEAMISARARAIDVSGIRRVFELGATLADPINLSIGQPDFPVPEPIKDPPLLMNVPPVKVNVRDAATSMVPVLVNVGVVPDWLTVKDWLTSSVPLFR